MSNKSKSLFHLLTQKHVALDHDSYKKVAAWFLGAKGENKDYMVRLLSQSIDEHAEFRAHNFKEGDPGYIDDTIKESPEYQGAQDALEEHVKDLSLKLHNSVPFFSPRYQAHMNWDTVMPGNLGYMTAMMYNQNNVATEGGPETCKLEKEVGQQLCRMFEFKRPDARSEESQFDSWGHITADGTIANIESMWVARNLKFYPLAIKEALMNTPQLAEALDKLLVEIREPEGLNGGKIVMVVKRKRLVDCTDWQLLNIDGDQITALPTNISDLCHLKEGELDTYLSPYLLQNVGLLEYARKYPELRNAKIFVPATKHYSWPKAGTLIGLGQDNIVGIPVDENCRMRMDSLREELLKCARIGNPVLMVVAVIGSTEEGVVDNLDGIMKLREECKTDPDFKYMNFNLHCDAAWGGYLKSMMVHDEPVVKADAAVSSDDGFVPHLPLSQYAQKQYSLLGHADTVTVDPHKAGFIPYPAGALCYRNGLMKSQITFNASYIHSDDNLNMGIYGLEGSKPGAAAAAVWLSHKTIGLHSGGYGQILGECSFSTKLYYCYWLTLADESDDFRLETLVPLPEKITRQDGSVIVEGGDILPFIRKAIIGKTNEEIAGNPDAIRVLQEVGTDVLINSFVLNYRKNGVWNTDIGNCNLLNQKIFERFSIVSPNYEKNKNVEYMLTSSEIDTQHYKAALKRIAGSIGLDTPSDDYSLTFLINTILHPWASTHDFINKITATFKAGVEDIIKNDKDLPVPESRVVDTREVKASDRVYKIPCDGSQHPARWFPLNNSYAGYVPANETDTNHLYYWFFESQTEPKPETPLILWLNGGPGASSLMGLLLENGPFTLNLDGQIAPNSHSWNKEAHVIYIDQPVGTGFSYTDDTKNGYVDNEPEMAEQVVHALGQFLGKHPKYAGCPLYITGESYAGKYLPFIAQEILRSAEGGETSRPLNFQGMAIGDGWMYPELQTRDQIEYAFTLGLVDTNQKSHFLNRYQEFVELLMTQKMEEACRVGMAIGEGLVKCGGGEDGYDVRSWGDNSLQALRTYLASPLVKTAINVPPTREWHFEDAVGPVSNHLLDDMMANVTDLFPKLVDFEDKAGHLKVLFYTGNFDLSCGFTGTEQILRQMNWRGKEQWKDLVRTIWYALDPIGEKVTQGCMKQLQNLTQIEIPMSGHQVPMYRPIVAQNMIYNWIFDKPFDTYDPLKQ